MTDIYNLIYSTLSALGYPVKEQGTYSENDTLPETFITYQIIDSPNNSFADNQPTSKTTRIQLAFYSKKPALKQSADETFKGIMLPAGFLRAGGRDLPYDHNTGHYGYTSDYRFYESEV